MAETKHNVAEHTCGNCAYWEGQHIKDQVSGLIFINPNEVATCGNPESPDGGHEVTPAHSCAKWQEE